jgi:hypothetical protein
VDPRYPNASRFVFPVVKNNVDKTVVADRIFKLGDLVSFREIGIEVMFAGEGGSGSDLAICRQTHPQGEFDHPIIQDGKRSGMSKAHYIDKRIRIGPKFGRLGAERLGVGEELRVNLETDYGLEPGRGFDGIRSHVPALVCALICACIAGCSIVSPSNSDDHVEFGDPYEIRVTNPSTGAPVDPFIKEGRLSIVVSYSGGCKEHEFELNDCVVSNAATIWLKHDANGDLCEAYITEELQIKLPGRVLKADKVLLLDPNGEAIALGKRAAATSPTLSTSERGRTQSGRDAGA